MRIDAEQKTALAACAYVAAIVAANMLVATYGPWFSVVNSFLLIGLDFSLRDSLHDRIGVWRVLGLVVLAGAISYITYTSAGTIAMASATSFVLANATDTAIYQKLIARRWSVKSNASNIGGAAVDSLVFPLLAFGALMPQIVIGQFAAKAVGGALWSVAIKRVRGLA